MHYIGIDIGTSSICGVAYDCFSEVVESVTIPNDAHLKAPEVWEKLQNPSRILSNRIRRCWSAQETV